MRRVSCCTWSWRIIRSGMISRRSRIEFWKGRCLRYWVRISYLSSKNKYSNPISHNYNKPYLTTNKPSNPCKPLNPLSANNYKSSNSNCNQPKTTSNPNKNNSSSKKPTTYNKYKYYRRNVFIIARRRWRFVNNYNIKERNWAI